MITLRRLTSSHRYLPFIDGLRFFAILPVILVHFVDFYEAHTERISNSIPYQKFHLSYVFGNSDNAVLLFFAISGFVLGLPFARHFFNNEALPGLKSFYTRRLTRLEPPYLLVLTGLMLLNVFLFHKSGLMEQLPHYFASFFYLHNIIYKAYPEINFVFWSLEIEVQFYLLAPLLAKVFKLKAVQRRTVLIAGMFVFSIINYYYQPPFISLLNYIQYFLAGFLALDLYLQTGTTKHYAFDGCTLVLLVLTWTGIITYGIALPFIIAGVMYCASRTLLLDKFISARWVSAVGGMCYSLYMLHHPVMAAFLNRVTGNGLLANSVWADFFIKFVLSLGVIFLISAAFFVLVERPCMKKDWYKNFLKRS